MDNNIRLTTLKFKNIWWLKSLIYILLKVKYIFIDFLWNYII